MNRSSKAGKSQKKGKEVVVKRGSKAPKALASGGGGFSNNPTSAPPAYGWTPSGTEIAHTEVYMSGAV